MDISDNLIFLTINGNEYWFTKQEVLLTISLIIALLIILISLLVKKAKNRTYRKIEQPKNKLQLNIEQYSYIIIECISISEKNFFKDNKNIKYDLFSQTLFYLYHLYICEQILSSKYSEEIVNEIILKAADIILDYQSKNQIDKKEFKDNMFYFLLNLKKEDIRINNKEDMQKLAKLFLDDNCVNQTDSIMILNLFMSFSTFIIYHAKDIVNEKIKLINI